MHFHSSGIFGWLLRYLLSAGVMMFAAGGSAIVGMGEGGGDGFGLGEGEGSGEGEGQGEGEGFGEGEGLGEGEGEGEFGEGDGQQSRQQLTPQQRADAAREARLPANVKKALAAVKETDPKAAEIIRRSVFASQAWAQVMPGGIRQAREMATAFDEVGGVEGIQTLRDEAQTLQGELDNVDTQWKSGSPEFIAGLAENDPEAFVKAAPVILEQLMKTDAPAYSALMGRIFYNTMTQKGVIRTMESLLNHANANKATAGMAPIIESLTALLNWSDSVRDLAQSQPERKPDKEREKLKKEREQFQGEQFKAFKTELGNGMRTHIENGIVREVGKLLKPLNISLKALQIKDKERFMSMVAEADRRLTVAITADKDFQKKKDRLVETRDKARVLRFYQDKIDFLLANPNGPRIALAVKKIFFNGIKPQPRQGGGDRGQGERGQGQGERSQQRQNNGEQRNTQVQRVAARPDASTIDYSKTTDDMILDGQAVLKGGKKVQWR